MNAAHENSAMLLTVEVDWTVNHYNPSCVVYFLSVVFCLIGASQVSNTHIIQVSDEFAR